jgi:outer membrane lipoprotein SlyB
MRGYAKILPIVFALLLVSCAKQDTGSGPHATVVMRDGTQYAGSITSTSPSEVTLKGDDNATHTLAMKDVRSIEYDDAAPPAETAQSSAKPAETAQSGAKAVPKPARRSLNHERHEHPQESAISSKTYALPAGTEIPVRTEEAIDSAKATEGQTFAAEVTSDVLDANGDVVIPQGANAQIIIRSATKGGRIKGTADLVLDLASVSVDGRMYQLSTTDLVKQGKTGMGANKRTAEYTGGGAAIGAIIGAIAGGGKGAAIGAGSGAGAGAITQMVTKGGSIKVPVETVLTFKLDKPLRVVAAR